MVRRTTANGPRLGALLDERDHLRIQINLAESADSAEPEILSQARHRLIAIERQIQQQWDNPES